MHTAPTNGEQAITILAPAQAARIERYREAERQLWLSTVGALPAERFVTLPRLGARVRLLEHGKGATLLFIHGGPSAASTWAPLLRQLAGFHCVLLERPGCGLSELPAHPPRHVREYMVQVVDESLAALGESPTAIVASSFGSYAALAFAAAHPSRVPPMVHLGAPALVPGGTLPLPMLLPCLPAIGPLVRRLMPVSVAAARQNFRWMGHPESTVQSGALATACTWYAALMRETSTRANDQTMFGRIRAGDRLRREELAHLAAPMSFFWGADDPFGGAAVARNLIATLPRATLELVAPAGHLPWLDEPEGAVAHVQAFLARSAQVS